MLLIVQLDKPNREVVPRLTHWFGNADLLFNWYQEKSTRTLPDELDNLSHMDIYVLQEGKMFLTRIDKWMLEYSDSQ